MTKLSRNERKFLTVLSEDSPNAKIVQMSERLLNFFGWRWSFGYIYMIALRLEERNLIGSCWAEMRPTGHRNRRYWITEIGKRALQENPQ